MTRHGHRIYDLFLAARQPEAADVLVRAKHQRRLSDGQGRITEHLEAQPPRLEDEPTLNHAMHLIAGLDGYHSISSVAWSQV